jgi:hypothetical protein
MAHLHRDEHARIFVMNYQKSSRRPVSYVGEDGPAFETRESALAMELWRVRGCPDGGMPECVTLATDIVRASAFSC